MNTFVRRFAHVVLGVLSGLDRVMFRGTLRSLCRPMGLQNYLWTNGVLYKDFDRHSQEVTQRLEAESLRAARALGRQICYARCDRMGFMFNHDDVLGKTG